MRKLFSRFRPTPLHKAPAPLAEHGKEAGQQASRFGAILGQVLIVLLFVYLLSQFFYADRGWFAHRAVSERVAQLEQEVEFLRQERDRLAHRINLLRDWSLDPDLLDEEALRDLGFGQEGDILILLPSDSDTAEGTEKKEDSADSASP